MPLNVDQRAENFLLVYHSCEPEDAKVLTRFKSDFYQVPHDSHPDNPRVVVRIPKAGESTEYGWRCGARDCEKCEKTASTLTSLTIPVAISHGIWGVPVQEQSGEVLGVLAVRGLRHRHATIFVQPKTQVRGKRAPFNASQPGSAQFEALKSTRGPRGGLDSPHILRNHAQQGSTRLPPRIEDYTVVQSNTAKKPPAARKTASIHGKKKVTGANDAEESLFVSEREQEYAVPTNTKRRAPQAMQSSDGEGIDTGGGKSLLHDSRRLKRKAKDAATVLLKQSSQEGDDEDGAQELGDESGIYFERMQESRAQRKERERRELAIVMSWDRVEQ
ncbi:hypothetical protein Tdes44962_MAKER07195 [Teratosphaeria destructans]|uniref:Uncharacterized protein n=1 Tax=Teratosphaeria destructans TaxID=418781 RepID=A0A9W7T0B0_9PEZI|nr:hypothetical protein Tdes44962_MAKER07195 [Teratosphaeria destructans]